MIVIRKKSYAKKRNLPEEVCGFSYHLGFTLIEVIVSLLLLSIILIGFNVLSIHSLKGQRNVFYFTQAVNQISSMKERLRALGDTLGLENQVSAWNLENSIVLPNGIGSVTGIYPEYTLNIYWGKPQSECENITIGENGCIKENFTA